MAEDAQGKDSGHDHRILLDYDGTVTDHLRGGIRPETYELFELVEETERSLTVFSANGVHAPHFAKEHDFPFILKWSIVDKGITVKADVIIDDLADASNDFYLSVGKPIRDLVVVRHHFTKIEDYLEEFSDRRSRPEGSGNGT